MARRNAQALAQAWEHLQRQLPARQATRTHAETFSWAATTQGQLDLFARVLGFPSSPYRSLNI